MSLRATRLMTSIFLVRNGKLLLLYRFGSSAIPDSWVGIGGHIEPDEIRDPTGAALRELHEEVGLAAEQISDLSLRYVSFRDTGDELRSTFYFTADLRPETPAPTSCPEGELRWFDIAPQTATLPMPPTASVALSHWLAEGRHDDLLRSIVMTATGSQVLSLAQG
ncbi:NUDIX domain-containing protein [Microlunatus soli]|uniref:NUDIX domain-containing protein n=1 Tax=Microlunatus soli TaxID=630515 RepID=A0A1H1X905_9ACTN|nr:NUDIX domain-containing protein [Microlunatus soli]SDT05550.1 NUDIX domain-containing protein [Microlunatus soli]